MSNDHNKWSITIPKSYIPSRQNYTKICFFGMLLKTSGNPGTNRVAKEIAALQKNDFLM
jgi:hypothetical protein